MHNLLQDFRYGLRTLRKNPGFAAAAILVLALGIGANTAIFSVVNAVLLRPLPFAHPEQLVQIWHTPPQKSFPGMKQFAVSAANYLDWQAQNHVFEHTAIYTWGAYNITGKGEPVFITARRVSSDFFAVLQAEPLRGRVFVPEEDHPGRDRVVVLSETFWRNQFAADPNIVGQEINLDGEAYRVIGVMRARFQFPITSDPSFAVKLWAPLAMTDRERAVRAEHHYAVIGRLRSGATVQQAQAELDTISHRLELEYPADDNGWGAVVIPLREELVGDVRTPLLVLLGAVALVLLIACANAANLVLARTISRQREIAVRSALGASRARVVRQVLCETVVLSLVGGALGLVIAHFGVKLIVAFFASKLPSVAAISLDASVLAFTLLHCVGDWHRRWTSAGDPPKSSECKRSVEAGKQNQFGRSWQSHARHAHRLRSGAVFDAADRCWTNDPQLMDAAQRRSRPRSAQRARSRSGDHQNGLPTTSAADRVLQSSASEHSRLAWN